MASRSTAKGEGRPDEEDLPLSAAPSLARATALVLSLALGFVAALWIVFRLRGVLLVLVLAVFFAYLVSPMVERFGRKFTIRGRRFLLPRATAIGAVYLLVFGSIAGTGLLLLPALDDQLGQLAREFPGYVTRVQALWQRWQAGYETHAIPQAVRAAIDRATLQAVTAGGTYVTNDLLPRLFGWLLYLPWLVLVPILAFFLLKDAGLLRKTALRFLPRGHIRTRGDVFLVELNDMLAAYIRAQVTACLLVGMACTVGFLVIGVPYAVLLGMTAGVLEFIPLAGPLTVGALAAGFAAFHSVGQTVAVVLFLLVLRAVQDYVVYPKIVGTGVHLHPLAVILAILCGAELGGLAGIFLAIPAVAALTLAFWHYRDHRAAEVENEISA